MSVDPTLLLPGMYSAIYSCSGTSNAITSEEMEEVDDIENGNPEYTVFKISDTDKDFLDPFVTTTFEKKIHGAGDFADIPDSDIREIQYPGGRLVLENPANSDDIIRLKSGNYFTKNRIWGALSTKISDKSVMKECTPMGALAKQNFPVIDEMSISLDIFLNTECAQLIANDLTLTHQLGGTIGNDISFEIINPETTHTLSITVNSGAIVVTLGYAAGAITSTNQNVVDLINGSAEVRRLKVVATCDLSDANSLADEFTEDNLAGGVDPINYSDKKDSLFGIEMFADVNNDIRFTGYGYLESIDSNPSPEEIVKQSLSLSCLGKIYFRPR